MIGGAQPAPPEVLALAVQLLDGLPNLPYHSDGNPLLFSCTGCIARLAKTGCQEGSRIGTVGRQSALVVLNGFVWENCPFADRVVDALSRFHASLGRYQNSVMQPIGVS
jgi:hypothetical protein